MKSYLQESVEKEDFDIVLKGMQHYSDELLSVINGNSEEDLPLIAAAMKIILKIFDKKLNEYGIAIENSLMEIVGSVFVDAGELLRQAKGGRKDG